jgi:aryl-alcohol dehydrogenase-like predicted oxidoreductase
MIYRELGPSGIKISAIGFGAWAIGGWMWGGADEGQAIDAIHAALDRGVTLIDTAPIYGFGRSEEIVGRAIRGRRESVVLATKCGMVWDRQQGDFFFHTNDQGVTLRPADKKVYKCLRPESIREEIQQSLRRLGTDHIDLYQTHWQDSTTPIADTMAALTRLRDEGKVRAIGVCNANEEQLRAYGPIDSDQEKYSLIDREIETNGVLAHCREHGIAMLAYSPLANGLLTGKIRPDRQFGPGDLRHGNRRFTAANIEHTNAMLQQLEPVARRHEASIPQLVVAWTFSQPGLTCALCGARDGAQAIENAAAGDIRLSAEEMDTIDAILTVPAAF